jgi:hypothetical protein
MEDKKFDDKAKILIFKRKIRCNLCHEIPIIKEILISNGVTCFITSECLNRHGLFLCPIKDFCDDKSQLDQLKCNICNSVQKVVNSTSKIFIFCKECNKFFCPKCAKSHYQKYLKTHHILGISELDYKCKEHMGPYSHFCVNCNKNLCPLCYQREHFKHDKIIFFDKIKLNEKEYFEVKFKIDEQRAQINIISQYLDNLVKLVNGKIDDYKNNLKMALQFNFKIFNCYIKDKLNYQSIVNFKKVIDIDITDIYFIKDIEKELEKFVEMIKSKSSYKILSADTKTSTPNIDKELLNTVKTITGTANNLDINDIYDNIKYKEKEKDEINEFIDNELLGKIGKKNNKILNKEDIFGIIKKIYSINEIKVYILIIDNGIFIYDQETNEILNYIDINEGFEYDEINLSIYYYNKNEKLVYLFIGTKANKIKIYTINENDDFEYKLIDEIKIDNLINISCNKNGELIILDKNWVYIYNNINDKYKKLKEIKIEENKNISNLFETKNHLILTIEGKEEILFLDKTNFEKLFYIDDIATDKNSKIFEINKDLIFITYKNKIKVINIKNKTVSLCYEKENINYVQCAEVFYNEIILISCNIQKKEDNTLVLFILKWDDFNKIIKEKDSIEDLECKMICKMNKNNAILYSRYGINVLELKD